MALRARLCVSRSPAGGRLVPPKKNPGGSLFRLREALSTSARAGLEIVDIVPAINERLEADERRHADLYWSSEGHFNAYGNRLYGLAVADLLGARLGGH